MRKTSDSQQLLGWIDFQSQHAFSISGMHIWTDWIPPCLVWAFGHYSALVQSFNWPCSLPEYDKQTHFFLLYLQCSHQVFRRWGFYIQIAQLPHAGVNVSCPAWFCISAPSPMDRPGSSALNLPCGQPFPLTTFINNSMTDNIHPMENQPYQLLFQNLPFPLSLSAPVSQSHFVIDSRALQWVGWWTACLRNTNRSTKLLRSFACWPRTQRMICVSSSTTRSTSSSSTRRASVSRVRPEDF